MISDQLKVSRGEWPRDFTSLPCFPVILGTLGTLGPLGASALLSDDRKRERAAKLLEEAGALVASGDVRSLGNIRRDLGVEAYANP